MAKFQAKTEIMIQAPQAKVWRALTEPALVKQWLFNTELKTDWKEGGPIAYKGVWQGHSYEDKGTVLKFVPQRLIVSTYWSSNQNRPDTPENYQKISYELKPEGKGTHLSLLQENVPTAEEAAHSKQNWNSALDKLKYVVEKDGALTKP